MIPGVTAKALNEIRIKGKIKVFPEDFVVAEVIKKGLSFKEGRHLLAIAEKKGVEHAVVSKTLGNIANYLGIKDKDALAYFFVSFKRVKINIKNVPGIRLRFVGKTKTILTRRYLLGNAFKVKIRDCECIENAFQNWKNILERWEAPNFYGMQRFENNNYVIGEALVKRDFKKADELVQEDGYNGIKDVPLWLRRFYVQAYQSYLFNRELSKVLNGEVSGEPIRMNFSEGFFNGSVEIAYLPGYGFRDKGDVYSKALIEVAKEEGIKFRHFYIDEYQEISQEGGIRPARIIAHKANYRINEGLNEAIVNFILYKGSYATVALRELLSDLG
ncbi:MAG: tRNA pseudouridine(13) synthase TruD [Nitrososphaeria archaeon]|nr:tRNA pseudouridine(13) synthase TruD [Conexivisphaerales archaeon]